MKRYFRGWISLPLDKYVPSITEKSVAFTVAGGYTTANDKLTWFPKSQLIIRKPNEYGNAEILIPYWLIRQKSNNPTDFYLRLREIGQYNGEPVIIEM